MNWYKHYIGDYQRDTGHLSMVEHGAYRLMLDTHYATEAPLPKTHSVLFRLLRAFTEAEQGAVVAILSQYWTETPDGYVNDRSGREFEKYTNKINAARENGNLGGRPKKTHDITETKTKTKTETEPAAKAPQNQIPDNQISSTPPKPPRGRVSVSRETDLDFETWWCQYPRRVGKGQAMKAYGHARLKTDAVTLLNGAARYAAERSSEDVKFTKHPTTWLNGQCWLDEPETTTNGKAGKRSAIDHEAQRRTDQAAVLAACGFNSGLAGGLGESAVPRAGSGSGDLPRGDSGGDRGGTGDAGTGKPGGPSRGAAETAELLPGVRNERAPRTNGPAGDLVRTSGGRSRGPAGRSREPDNEGMEVPIASEACGPESGHRARPDGPAEAAALGTDGQTGDVDLQRIPDFLRRMA